MEATISAAGIWTGEPQRDEHLRSVDFLDVTNHPTITFKSTKAERIGGTEYQLTGELTIRGVTRHVTLTLRYLGRWRTPYNDARVARLGFTGETRINRHDFAVSWNSQMEDAGTVVGSDVVITIDVEAHSLMEKLNIDHEYPDVPARKHQWGSGWLPEAVRLILVAPKDSERP
jgi:polyisoprenoid-binding protein YceI